MHKRAPQALRQEVYQLDRWAARGQLGWLDWTQPDLPLCLGPQQPLPALYTNIAGWHRLYSGARAGSGGQVSIRDPRGNTAGQLLLALAYILVLPTSCS